MPEGVDFEKRFTAAVKGLEKKAAIAEDPGNTPLALSETTEEHEGKKEKPARPIVINLFQHPDSHPVVLDLLLLRKYGPDWLSWESEFIREKIPVDFPTKDLSDLNMEKIQAVRVLHLNDTFWQRWENFNPIVQVFNNQFPDFQKLQVPATAMIAVAIDTAKRIREDVKWSPEVVDYMRMVCRYDGVFRPPEPLGFLEVEVKHGFVDTDEIAEKWPAVRKSSTAPTGDTIVDEQLRRNLTIHQYLEEFRGRLSNQLSLVSYG